jgi:hypothetical protein
MNKWTVFPRGGNWAVIGCLLSYILLWEIREATAKTGGTAPPEARLTPALIGCLCIPIGLF